VDVRGVELMTAVTVAIERWEPKTAIDVMTALVRVRDWLRDQTSISVVQDGIGLGQALRAVVRQRDLGREAELAAAEIVRRAERRLGELVREAQDRGEVATRSSNHHARPEHQARDVLPTARDILGSDEARSAVFVFAAADEDTFEEALAACRTDGTMARAAVRRQLTRDRILRPVPEPKPRPKRGPKIDPNRVVRESVLMLEGIVAGLANIDPHDVTDPDVQSWARSLTESITILSQLRKALTHD